MSYVYVVTNPENGWDCVIDVCSDKDFAYNKYSKEIYIIHKMKINESVIKESKFSYKVADFNDVEDMCLICDTLEITNKESGDLYLYKENSRKAMEYVCNLFKEFCKIRKIKPGNVYITTFENNKKSWCAFCDDISIDEWGGETGIGGDFFEWAEATHNLETQ